MPTYPNNKNQQTFVIIKQINAIIMTVLIILSLLSEAQILSVKLRTSKRVRASQSYSIQKSFKPH